MPDQPQSAPPTAPTIRRLTIERFRGIETLRWNPGSGVNIILGGGDVGKTTILEAIALLLNPTTVGATADTDYYLRKVEAEFVIEAVMTLPPDSGINDQFRPSWPWTWNGTDAVVPNADGEGESGEPVYRIRVRGSADLELGFELVQPDGNADPLGVALRRSIGLLRLSGDERGDRDLRLVHGSALDKLVSDKSLRSRIAFALSNSEIENELDPAGMDALKELEGAFKDEGLPSALKLSIIGSPGPSIASLIGLTADRSGVPLPLTAWGAGTRRLSALAIAAHNQRESPITIVDEVERGLEPYRQCLLMRKLQEGGSQVFVTTHSPSAIAAGADSYFWYVDTSGKIGRLDKDRIARHRTTDPATFLSRFTIIAEGKTEVGFVSRLLEKALGTHLDQHGIHVSEGGGNQGTLDLLEALAKGGVAFGGFADNEGPEHASRWQRLVTEQGTKVFRWASGCLEKNIIDAVPDESLEALTDDSEGEKTGMRQRTLQERLDLDEKSFPALRAAAPGDHFRAVIIDAATGSVPNGTPDDEKKHFKSHAQTWFKTVDGGRELADKMFTLGLWQRFKDRLLPFCNGVRSAIGLEEIEDIQA